MILKFAVEVHTQQNLFRHVKKLMNVLVHEFFGGTLSSRTLNSYHPTCSCW